MRKLKLALALAVLPAVLCTGKIWLGVGAVAAAHGASWQTGAGIGALGVADGVLYSIALAGVVSGPVGIAVGAGIGL